MEVDRVEHRTPQIVLALMVGGVSHAHRTCTVVTREVIELLLGELTLSADAIHDLQLARLRLGEVGDKVKEVVGLPVEAQCV